MFTNPTKIALACAGIFATVAPTHAQTKSSEFNPVVVSASRTEQLLSDVLPSASVITRAEIDKSQAINLAELLQGEAGFEFARNGGPGSITSFFLRGQESKNVIVIVDGVRLKDEITGTSQVENIPLAHIERVEILRGNASALYGQGAVGGVIQVFTRAGKGEPKPYAYMTYGSKNTSDIAVGYGGQLESYKFNFGVSQQSTEGNSAINPQQAGMSGANPDNDGYRSNAMNGSLSKNLGGGSEIGLRVSAVYAKLDYDDYYSPAVSTDIHTQTSANYLTGVYLRNQINSQWTSQFDFNASQVEIKAHKNGGIETNNDTRQNQLKWFNTYQLNDLQTLNFGAENTRSNSVSVDSYSNSDASRDARAVFAGYQASYGSLNTQANIRYDNLSSGQEAITGLLGVGYTFIPGFKAIANSSTGFNVPTLYEQTDTPSLKPEKYKSQELGMVVSNQNHLTRLVYFNSSTTNAISYTGSGSSNNYENIGQVDNKGFELTSKASLYGYLVKLTAVAQDPWDVSNNRELQRRAKEYGSIDVSKPLKDYDLGVKLYASGERKDRTVGSNTLAGYSIWSFYASKKIDRDWVARLKLDNAFDKDHQLAYGYNTLGRSLFLTLQYQPK